MIMLVHKCITHCSLICTCVFVLQLLLFFLNQNYEAPGAWCAVTEGKWKAIYYIAWFLLRCCLTGRRLLACWLLLVEAEKLTRFDLEPGFLLFVVLALRSFNAVSTLQISSLRCCFSIFFLHFCRTVTCTWCGWVCGGNTSSRRGRRRGIIRLSQKIIGRHR